MKIYRLTIQTLFLLGLWLCTGLQAQAQTGTVTYIYTDQQGTPLAEADVNGNITATFDYTPYGSQALGTAPNGPGYTGHVNDPDTGLVYMQARYYDPSVGRFLSTDPIGPAAGNAFNFNRYAYANNNPVMHTDPDGRQVAPGDDGPIAMQNRWDDPAVAAGELQAAGGAAPVFAGLIPGVGDAQNVFQAVNDPTPLNISVAVVGAIPEVGGLASKVLKEVSSVSKSVRRVGDFTRAQKNTAKAENAAANAGKMACADCGKTLENVKSEKGVSTPSNQAQVHHDPAIKDGGGQHSEPVVLCPPCHIERHNSGG